MTLWCHIKCLLKNPGHLNKSGISIMNTNAITNAIMNAIRI
ncbi:hypothetical protein [Plasmodium yoelii yoelii]|uniref:Uncharacterized protein n=1 Tax=Plasmodium yoelii yoelii TaxID=73239 RepID=Q7RQH7_PLAYO|nr:hypothetical protein [Plasmodium yoelii yoelii]